MKALRMSFQESMLPGGSLLIHCWCIPSIISGKYRAANRSLWPEIPIAMRYESTQTMGSSEGSYFLAFFGALNGCGYLSPRTMGPKQAGPTRASRFLRAGDCCTSHGPGGFGRASGGGRVVAALATAGRCRCVAGRRLARRLL